MQALHMTHPDQVEELPMEFSSWVLHFVGTEKQAQAEAEERASKQ